MEIILFLAGGVVSWVVAHWYHKRSSTEVPEWAKPLVENLPDQPVSRERLIELYHDALETGAISMPDPIGGYLACPSCGAPSSEFEPWGAIDPDRGDEYNGFRCGKCKRDVSWTQV